MYLSRGAGKMFIPSDHLAPMAEAHSRATCRLSSQQWGGVPTPPHPLCLAPPTFHSCSVSQACFLSIPLASSSLGLLLMGPLTPHVTPSSWTHQLSSPSHPQHPPPGARGTRQTCFSALQVLFLDSLCQHPASHQCQASQAAPCRCQGT